LLSKNIQIKIYKIILPLVLYGCEMWSLKLKEEQRLKEFENSAQEDTWAYREGDDSGP